MKKFLIYITSLLIFLGNSGFFVNAENSEVEHSFSYNYMTELDFQQDFVHLNSEGDDDGFNMITYFRNLNDYSPRNRGNSCGYVSFIQYLSYYDTFRNDGIIPTVYERSIGNMDSIEDALSTSPGVLRVNYPVTNLYTYIQNNKGIDFQMYLMDIVNASYGRTSEEYISNIGMWEYYIILNELFIYNANFNYTSVSSFGSYAKPTDENVINYFDQYVKGQLDMGNPVILHIAKYNATTKAYDNYHSVVAYYYDEDGIHANFGWGGSSSDTIISDSYQIVDAGIMNLTNIPINHSNNYLINEVHYCGCGEVYNHTHSYDYIYVPLNQLSHQVYCNCGEYIVEIHNWKLYGSDYQCNKCWYISKGNVIVPKKKQ